MFAIKCTHREKLVYTTLLAVGWCFAIVEQLGIHPLSGEYTHMNTVRLMEKNYLSLLSSKACSRRKSLCAVVTGAETMINAEMWHYSNIGNSNLLLGNAFLICMTNVQVLSQVG